MFHFFYHNPRPLLRSSGQSSWLQIQRSGFDSRRYQIFWEIEGMERGPLSLMSTTEEQFERKHSGSSLESREYDRRNPSRWPRDTFYPQKFALTSPTSGGRSVGIVRSRTQVTHFLFYLNSQWMVAHISQLSQPVLNDQYWKLCRKQRLSEYCYCFISRRLQLHPSTNYPGLRYVVIFQVPPCKC
jgi:hypothetical protein